MDPQSIPPPTSELPADIQHELDGYRDTLKFWADQLSGGEIGWLKDYPRSVQARMALADMRSELRGLLNKSNRTYKKLVKITMGDVL